MALVITACTNRKRRSAEAIAAAVPAGPVDAVAAAWRAQLARATAMGPAGDLYCGTSFLEASAAARLAGASLVVVSAGLGLVRLDDQVPGYALTVVAGSDNILDRTIPRASGADWWAALNPGGDGLADCIDGSVGPVLMALPGAYLRMLERSLQALGPARIARLRIFSRARGDVSGGLGDQFMPYDERLDGPASPRAGTLSSFAARAARDFAEYILPRDLDGDAACHRALVDARLAAWPAPTVRAGERRTDAEITRLIETHWAAAGGRTGRLLRLLRDDLGVACEQGRFARLARTFRAGAGA